MWLSTAAVAAVERNWIGVLLLVAWLAFIGPPSVANAASIEVLSEEPWAGTEFEGQIKCNVRLNGEIVAGDLDRLRGIYDFSRSGLQGKVFSGGQDAPSFLCLDSPGGSYKEAIKIVEFLTASGAISTVVEADRSCFSACAIIFMAGSSAFHLGRAPGRWLHVRGSLGFHAPFLEKSNLPPKLSADEAIAVYIAAQRGIAELIRVFSISEVDVDRQFFVRPWVRKSLFLQMSLVGPDSLYDIDTIDRAGRWGVALFGLPERNRLPPRSLETACKNAAAWINDEFAGEKKWTGYYNVKRQSAGAGTGAASNLEVYWMTSRQTFSCAATFSTDKEGNVDGVTATFFDGAYAPGGTEIGREAGEWLSYPPEMRLRDLETGSQD